MNAADASMKGGSGFFVFMLALLTACGGGKSSPTGPTAAPTPSQAIAYVKASNTGAGDYFGYSIALSGDGNTLAADCLEGRRSRKSSRRRRSTSSSLNKARTTSSPPSNERGQRGRGRRRRGARAAVRGFAWRGPNRRPRPRREGVQACAACHSVKAGEHMTGPPCVPARGTERPG